VISHEARTGCFLAGLSGCATGSVLALRRQCLQVTGRICRAGTRGARREPGTPPTVTRMGVVGDDGFGDGAAKPYLPWSSNPAPGAVRLSAASDDWRDRHPGRRHRHFGVMVRRDNGSRERAGRGPAGHGPAVGARSTNSLQRRGMARTKLTAGKSHSAPNLRFHRSDDADRSPLDLPLEAPDHDQDQARCHLSR